MEGLLRTLDLKWLKLCVVLVFALALVEVEAAAGMLLIALNIKILQSIFNIVYVILWHHRIAQAGVELEQGRFYGYRITTIHKLKTLERKRPRILRQLDPLDVIV